MRPLRRLPRGAGSGLQDLPGRFDNNKYPVAASAVGRPVEVHAYADRIVIRQDGRIVAEHSRIAHPWPDASYFPSWNVGGRDPRWTGLWLKSPR
jgi:hypothetical protein